MLLGTRVASRWRATRQLAFQRSRSTWAWWGGPEGSAVLATLASRLLHLQAGLVGDSDQRRDVPIVIKAEFLGIDNQLCRIFRRVRACCCSTGVALPSPPFTRRDAI